MPDVEEVFDVLCYGKISIDNITRVPFLPTPKRDAVAKAEYNSLGGEALTVATALSVWGVRVLVMGNLIGTDWKGEFIMRELVPYENLDVRYIRQHENVPTPFVRVLVTPDGERSRISYWHDDTPKVELTPDIMRRTKILSVDAYGRGERDRAARVARDLNATVISADAIWPQYPLASLSDVIVISRAWLQTNFPGVYEYDHILDLQAQGAGIIIVTDGPRPVLVVRADGSAFGVEPYYVPDAIECSGAGNLFKAGIIYGWMHEDWPLEQKVRFACAAAGAGCRRDAVSARPPALQEISDLMERRRP
jgi:sugar/nucleoside kinase (ribokinase family)